MENSNNFNPRKGDIYLLDVKYNLLLRKEHDKVFYIEGEVKDKENHNIPEDYFGVHYLDQDNEIITILFYLKGSIEHYFFTYNEVFARKLINIDSFVCNIGPKGINNLHDAIDDLQNKTRKEEISEATLNGIVLYELNNNKVILTVIDRRSKNYIKTFEGTIATYDKLLKEYNSGDFYHFSGTREKSTDYAYEKFDILIDKGSGCNHSETRYQKIFNDKKYTIIGRVDKEQIEEFLSIFTSECKVDYSEIVITPGQLYLLNGSTTGAYIEDVNKSTGMIKFKQVEIMLNDVEQEKPVKKRFIYESRELYILMKENNRVFDLGIHTKGMNIELESRHVSLNRYIEMIKKNQLVLYCSDFKI